MTTFDFTAFPTLHTQRLTLRQLQISDAEAVYTMRSNYAVTRYNIGNPYTNIRQAITLIRNINAEYRKEQSLRWGIILQSSDAVIGMVGFNYWNRQDNRSSIGFDLRQDHWRRGIMSEAVDEVLRFGFEDMRLNRIEADASTENIGSIGLLHSVGFTQEGVQREQYFDDGRYHDLMMFALLKRDWQAQRLREL
jgi:ribosomal-protein-alanine N-acetyltransferase